MVTLQALSFINFIHLTTAFDMVDNSILQNRLHNFTGLSESV